jgi:hypothetical protein
MKTKKQQIEFMQNCGGEHSIRVNDQKVEIDLNKLDIADVRTLINGLANILSSLSACMYKFQEEARK